jgi:hypothetical protein
MHRNQPGTNDWVRLIPAPGVAPADSETGRRAVFFSRRITAGFNRTAPAAAELVAGNIFPGDTNPPRSLDRRPSAEARGDHGPWSPFSVTSEI